MKAIGEMTQVELAAYIQEHLRERGVKVVLSGGAAVSYFSANKYISLDLDLVNVGFAKRRLIREAMQALGFKEEDRHFVHPDTEFFVEFPPGPLAVGAEPVTAVIEVELTTGVLDILSPTDCVKDRLANYYHWGDRQSLEQALLVAGEVEVDLEEIERWSTSEGKANQFVEIKDRFEQAQDQQRG